MSVSYREHARKIYAKLGPLGSLAWLATNDVFPKVDAVLEMMAKMEERGVGSFRKMATTYVSDDERVLAEDPQSHAFDEQYDIAWTLAVKTSALFLDEFLTAGLGLVDVTEFLARIMVCFRRQE